MRRKNYARGLNIVVFSRVCRFGDGRLTYILQGDSVALGQSCEYQQSNYEEYG